MRKLKITGNSLDTLKIPYQAQDWKLPKVKVAIPKRKTVKK